MIGVRAPKEELDCIAHYCQEMNLPMPNLVIDVYKNRRGKMCDVKIFRKFDYGTCRVKDILITTNSTYQKIDGVILFDYGLEEKDLSEYE